MSGVYKEIWTGEVVKRFTKDTSFLSTLSDRSDLVDNDVIHLVDFEGNVEVLINNNTYPIATVDFTDDDIPLALDKFDTKNTPISDDVLYAISYNLMEQVAQAHADALREKMALKAIHAICPSANGAKTPVIATSGGTDGGANPRKKFAKADLIALNERADLADIPKEDRILVLDPRHVAQILDFEQSFRDQYTNIQAGKVLNLYGFQVYEFNGTPTFTNLFVKKAFGAAAAPATDCYASVFYQKSRVFKSIGSTTMYYSEASTQPELRRSVVGFRQRFIALPKKLEALGAIVSGVFS